MPKWVVCDLETRVNWSLDKRDLCTWWSGSKRLDCATTPVPLPKLMSCPKLLPYLHVTQAPSLY